MANCDVVEQDQMLMDLPHVADMWNHRQVVFPRHQADCQELADARDTRAVHLDEVDGSGFHVVLEHHPVWDVLA